MNLGLKVLLICSAFSNLAAVSEKAEEQTAATKTAVS